jgi:DNA-binding transcriptional ArsR family regulator
MAFDRSRAADPLARIGTLLGDPTRAEMLSALLDGRAHTVGELARHAGVAASTASEHLSRLLDGGVVVVTPQGRHRYYRLAGPEVAAVLEAVSALPDAPVGPAAAARPRVPAALAHARSCYDHLAGTVGVALHDRLAETGSLRPDGVALTDAGRALLHGLGVDPDVPVTSRRPYVRSCLDWTERRHHLAGALGAAVLTTLLDRRWLVHRGPPRALAVTAAGRGPLGDLLVPARNAGDRVSAM